MNRTTTILLTLLAIGVIAAGSAAYAAIPGADGTIAGCYDKQSGQLRVTDPATNQPKACTAKESAISWGRKGGKAYHWEPLGHKITETSVTPNAVFFEKALPPGTYEIRADVSITAGGSTVPLEVVTCGLGISQSAGSYYSSYDYGKAAVAGDATGDFMAGTIALSRELTVAANGTGKTFLFCWAPSPAWVQDIDIWAIERDSIGS